MVWSNPNPNNLAPPVSDELRTITGRSGEIDCASWQSSKPNQNPNHQRRTQKGIIARRTSDGHGEKEPPASPAARKEGFGVGGRTPAAVSLLLRLRDRDHFSLSIWHCHSLSPMWNGTVGWTYFFGPHLVIVPVGLYLVITCSDLSLFS
jgi:hypothetical protein